MAIFYEMDFYGREQKGLMNCHSEWLMILRPKPKYLKSFMMLFGLVTEEFGPLIQKSKSDIGERAYTTMLRSL